MEKALDQYEKTHNMVPLKNPEDLQGVILPKSKCMPKSRAMPAHQIPVEVAEDEIDPLDPWDVMDASSTSHVASTEMIDALQVRVLNMEGALAEILTLQMLRQAGDIDAEIENSLAAVAHFNSTTPHHLHRKCHQLVQQFSDELASLSQSCLQRSGPLQVFGSLLRTPK